MRNTPPNMPFPPAPETTPVAGSITPEILNKKRLDIVESIKKKEQEFSTSIAHFEQQSNTLTNETIARSDLGLDVSDTTLQEKIQARLNTLDTEILEDVTLKDGEKIKQKVSIKLQNEINESTQYIENLPKKDDIINQINPLRNRNTARENRISELNAKITTLTNDIETITNNVRESESDEIERLQKRRELLEKEKTKAESELKVLQGDIAKLNQLDAQLSEINTIPDVRDQIATKKIELENLKKKEKLKQDLIERQQKLQNFEQQKNASEVKLAKLKQLRVRFTNQRETDYNSNECEVNQILGIPNYEADTNAKAEKKLKEIHDETNKIYPPELDASGKPKPDSDPAVEEIKKEISSLHDSRMSYLKSSHGAQRQAMHHFQRTTAYHGGPGPEVGAFSEENDLLYKQRIDKRIDEINRFGESAGIVKTRGGYQARDNTAEKTVELMETMINSGNPDDLTLELSHGTSDLLEIAAAHALNAGVNRFTIVAPPNPTRKCMLLNDISKALVELPNTSFYSMQGENADGKTQKRSKFTALIDKFVNEKKPSGTKKYPNSDELIKVLLSSLSVANVSNVINELSKGGPADQQLLNKVIQQFPAAMERRHSDDVQKIFEKAPEKQRGMILGELFQEKKTWYQRLTGGSRQQQLFEELLTFQAKSDPAHYAEVRENIPPKEGKENDALIKAIAKADKLAGYLPSTSRPASGDELEASDPRTSMTA